MTRITPLVSRLLGTDRVSIKHWLPSRQGRYWLLSRPPLYTGFMYPLTRRTRGMNLQIRYVMQHLYQEDYVPAWNVRLHR